MTKNNRHIYPTRCGQVAVVPIGNLAELEHNATAEELQSVEGITALSSRVARLAWRALLREMLSPTTAEVSYLPSGKPQIRNSQYQHISVSHSRDYVAVALSQDPCGVDVERIDRNFEHVKSRYITVAESQLSADRRWAAVVWCAKEALYKYAGREGLDFLRDIVILSVQQQGESWSLVAELLGTEHVELRGECLGENHILVFTM